MADNVPLGMEFMRWQNVPSISETFQRSAQGQFNPLMYAAGYALNKLSGESDFSQKMMGKAPVAPQPGMGQGLSLQKSPVIPPNGGEGLAQPSGMFDYTPKTDIFNQQPAQQQMPVQQDFGTGLQMPTTQESWAKRAFGGFLGGQ